MDSQEPIKRQLTITALVPATGWFSIVKLSKDAPHAIIQRVACWANIPANSGSEYEGVIGLVDVGAAVLAPADSLGYPVEYCHQDELLVVVDKLRNGTKARPSLEFDAYTLREAGLPVEWAGPYVP